ncbi:MULTISPECIES: hypothetical protein [Actinomycetes]|uniref:hypothetical protein n=1 Tax=Actinomycetes TaxID=1760 RepID=UPI0011803049|nr:hypothetical protein [Streptomyces murinus]WDO04919.1 hypothetical protein ME763_04245 [Streptomyces murinus]
MAALEHPVPAVESGLVDLSGISLEALRSLDDRTFTESLEQLLHHIDGPQAITVSYSPPRLD